MKRIAFTVTLLSFLFTSVFFFGTPQQAQRKPTPRTTSKSNRDQALWQRALAIHRRAIVIDTHNDVTTPMTNDDYDLSGTPPAPYRTSIERMKKGGLTAEFFSLYIRPWYVTHGGAARRTLDMIDSVYRAVERHPKDLMFATSAADIRRAKAQNKIACLMGIEGGHAIENSLATLREFYRLGVRYMTLTHNNSNDWADSSRDVAKHNGLTDFGREVVREMNRIGMLVDVSHVSDKTMSDVLDVSTAPIIASHSSARALANRPRNIPDDLLRRIAKNGGVVMVNFYPAFLSDAYNDAENARDARIKPQRDALEAQFKDDPKRLEEELKKLTDANPIPKVPMSAIIDHIDHVVKVAGIDHVGIGSDFDGVPCLPQGIDSVADLPKITQALLDRGYTREQIHKVLGGNLLRVFRQVEAVSRRLQSKTSAAPAAK